MCDNRSGEHPNDHGGGQHKTDVLRLQSALAQQRRDKRRLHAERAVEQGVCGQKYPEGRRSGHNVEPTAAPATRRPPSVWAPATPPPLSRPEHAEPPAGPYLATRAIRASRSSRAHIFFKDQVYEQ